MLMFSLYHSETMHVTMHAKTTITHLSFILTPDLVYSLSILNPIDMLHLLMLYLKVKVSCEPVIEPTGFHITGCHSLGSQPIMTLVIVNLHGDVGHLCYHGEPETLDES